MLGPPLNLGHCIHQEKIYALIIMLSTCGISVNKSIGVRIAIFGSKVCKFLILLLPFYHLCAFGIYTIALKNWTMQHIVLVSCPWHYP